MAIVTNKKAIKTPGRQEVKYYLIAKVVGRKTEKDLAERICRNTTLSMREAMMALAELRRGVEDFILDSYSVEISDWISFRPTIQSKGAETMAECDHSLVKSVHCRCNFSKEFRQTLQRATFVDAGALHTNDPGD